MNWAVDYIVEPGYRQVMDIPLQRGRFFTPQDDEHSPLVAVIDEVFAQKHFPNQDPIGKRIVLKNSPRKLEIVGIVGHVKQWGLDLDDNESLRAQLYIPCMQMPDDFIAMVSSGTSLAVRYDGNLSPVFDAIRHTSSQQVIFGDQTMESIITDFDRRTPLPDDPSRSIRRPRSGARRHRYLRRNCLCCRTAHAGDRDPHGAGRATQRRAAPNLGAWNSPCASRRRHRDGWRLRSTRLMTDLLFGVAATDPVTFSVLAVILTVVAVTACYLPARRATRLDPVAALRWE